MRENRLNRRLARDLLLIGRPEAVGRSCRTAGTGAQMETENHRTIIIKDIGRPRIRSSRPVPPTIGERQGRHRISGCAGAPPQVRRPCPGAGRSARRAHPRRSRTGFTLPFAHPTGFSPACPARSSAADRAAGRARPRRRSPPPSATSRTVLPGLEPVLAVSAARS